ncbi:TetR/AcrR family transcriptional regulator [Gordonia hydrophobica]|uniref:TetR/AcrR family transcriptional regulator n=1 Tax=Gordonia hydrophobica TaxID=40516 RepID=A0ABZ2U8V5_9ACTN|nr:TetR/AcrR family transcriptional regulator [Gordonia hydrophobica]MBM7368654.1 AcrR family transcriptional regulator [Gordonia hydrophobica]
MPRDTSIHASAAARTAKSLDELSEKGIRTRARLIVAARVVFERDGFLSSRISDIVKEAGAAYGTFYTYFPSKEAALLAVIEEQQRSVEEAARVALEAAPRTARGAVEASNRAYLEGYARHFRLMESWVEAAAVHQELDDLLEGLIEFNVERTERFLRTLLDRGEIFADIDPSYAAQALNAMIMQYSIRVFRHGPDAVDLDTATRTVTDIWCRGIGLVSEAPRG